MVAPKKVRLKEAEEELGTTMAQLNEKRAELRAVEERLASLKQQFQEMIDKKAKLELQVGIVSSSTRENWKHESDNPKN